MNEYDPNLLTAEERLDEVAAILAAGIQRLADKTAGEPFGTDQRSSRKATAMDGRLQKKEMEKIPLDKSPGTRPYVRKTHRNGERT